MSELTQRRGVATLGGVFFISIALLLITGLADGPFGGQWATDVGEEGGVFWSRALPVVYYLVLLLLGVSLLARSRHTIFMLAFYAFLLVQQLVFTALGWLPPLPSAGLLLLLGCVLLSLYLLYTDAIRIRRTPQIVSGFLTAVLFNLLILYYLS